MFLHPAPGAELSHIAVLHLVQGKREKKDVERNGLGKGGWKPLETVSKQLRRQSSRVMEMKIALLLPWFLTHLLMLIRYQIL